MVREPHPGARRVAFVGQSTFFRSCVPPEKGASLETTFIEFREGKDPAPVRAALDRFDPDAVVVFRPEVVPRGAFADVAAPILGFLTEPVPRTLSGRPHPDLAKRRRDLQRLDPANIDRLASFDPLIAPVAERIFPIWRSLPIPVGDRLFREPARLRLDPLRIVFVGRSTPHREAFLRPVKAAYDLLHVAFGAAVDELDGLLSDHDVTLNLHNEPYPSFENRVSLHLAAGHLVISETLNPRHGLEPGRDYIEIQTPDDIIRVLADVENQPDRADAMRQSGREQAERFRASTVFADLIEDLLTETQLNETRRDAGRLAPPAGPESHSAAP